MDKMEKSIESVKRNFGTVRTGRASPSMLDRIQVEYYGAPTPLQQIANISTPEATLLVIQPYDISAIPDIERAIQQSDVGLTPNNDGKVIRLQVPPLTSVRVPYSVPICIVKVGDLIRIPENDSSSMLCVGTS